MIRTTLALRRLWIAPLLAAALLGVPAALGEESGAPKVEVLEYPAQPEGSERTYKVAILMINTLPEPIEDNEKTKRLEFYSPEKLGELFFTHNHGSNAFLREASYGRIALEGTVVGWMDAPKAGLDSSDILSDSSYYFGLANAHIRFADYDIFIVHALVEGRGQQTGWLYPQQSINTPQGTIRNIGISWMINSSVFDEAPLDRSYWSSADAVLPTTSWAHELIHCFGIAGHSNSYNCGDETLSTTGTENPIRAYGGVFSIMGEHAFGTHPDVLMKSKLGWLKPDQMPTIEKSGVYEVYPIATQDSNVKGLMIPFAPAIGHEAHTATFDGFFIEYRTAEGFDRYLKRLDGSPFLSVYKPDGAVDSGGIAVYMKYATDTDTTLLLDMNPDTPFNADRGIKTQGNVGKFADAILPVDRSFNYEDRILITPLGVTQDGAMRVRVEIQE